ncbi:hypothetical protein HII31_06557 [Pseudocercospora fuligena]|uniref:Uncharacterized protein n=1 Tax=Pseudocercospora fuligena TaxID=685502 RepID=A0A8H6RLB9_9PEZI|nr:hypothetical protein HII31_06557 [Pseudocercospora fuligena]
MTSTIPQKRPHTSHGAITTSKQGSNIFDEEDYAEGENPMFCTDEEDAESLTEEQKQRRDELEEDEKAAKRKKPMMRFANVHADFELDEPVNIFDREALDAKIHELDGKERRLSQDDAHNPPSGPMPYLRSMRFTLETLQSARQGLDKRIIAPPAIQAAPLAAVTDAKPKKRMPTSLTAQVDFEATKHLPPNWSEFLRKMCPDMKYEPSTIDLGNIEAVDAKIREMKARVDDLERRPEYKESKYREDHIEWYEILRTFKKFFPKGYKAPPPRALQELAPLVSFLAETKSSKIMQNWIDLAAKEGNRVAEELRKLKEENVKGSLGAKERGLGGVGKLWEMFGKMASLRLAEMEKGNKK